VQWTETDIKNLKYYLGLTDSQLKYKEWYYENI
jgi:hypothetical protein